MNLDGIRYLDIGDAFIRGYWNNAISALWSGLYGWLLGIVTWLIRPTPAWEFPVVHLVNLLIFAASLASFEFLLSSLAKVFIYSPTESKIDRRSAFPEWALRIWGCTIFI
jgi:hypothetical protein